MDKADKKHTGFTVVLSLLSVLAFHFGVPVFCTALLVFILLIYVVLIFFQCAIRAKQKDDEKPDDSIFNLPNRTWALALVFLFVQINVTSFANMYLKSEGVYNQSVDEKPLLANKLDAIYYSAVTLTTLGYGDFIPNEKGRLLVVYQLISGLCILLIIVPVVAARATTW